MSSLWSGTTRILSWWWISIIDRKNYLEIRLFIFRLSQLILTFFIFSDPLATPISMVVSFWLQLVHLATSYFMKVSWNHSVSKDVYINNYVMYDLHTLILTHLTTLCTFASQKAPLYLADTSVPTLRNGGSSGCGENKIKMYLPIPYVLEKSIIAEH